MHSLFYIHSIPYQYMETYNSSYRVYYLLITIYVYVYMDDLNVGVNIHSDSTNLNQ